MKSWNVITPDNEKIVWFESWRTRLFRQFPDVDKDGFVWLDGKPYVVDDGACIREYYHDRKLAGYALIGGLLLASVLSVFSGLIGGASGFIIGLVLAFVLISPRKEDRHHYWLQNEPAPLVFGKNMTPGSVGITGETIRTYAKSQHLSRLVSPETNWMIVAIICILVGIMAGAIGYSVGLSQGIGK